MKALEDLSGRKDEEGSLFSVSPHVARTLEKPNMEEWESQPAAYCRDLTSLFLIQPEGWIRLILFTVFTIIPTSVIITLYSPG